MHGGGVAAFIRPADETGKQRQVFCYTVPPSNLVLCLLLCYSNVILLQIYRNQ